MTAIGTEEYQKPTSIEHKGHGYGLASMLLQSWESKHQLQPFESASAAVKALNLNKNEFVPTSCSKLSFCHCGRDPAGEQAFFLHSKLVSLLRPYLFNREPRRKKDEKKETKKKKKIHTPARRALMKGFLVVKFEPQYPDRSDGDDGDGPGPDLMQLGGWGQLANQAT